MSADNFGIAVQVQTGIEGRDGGLIEYYVLEDKSMSDPEARGWFCYFNTREELLAYVEDSIFEYGVSFHFINYCPHCGGKL